MAGNHRNAAAGRKGKTNDATAAKAGRCVLPHSLLKLPRFVILEAMKAALRVTLALTIALPAFGQITARRLTRNVAPQPQQPARTQPMPQYGVAPAAPARPLTKAELAKIKSDKSKNQVKQFEYYKRRATEGSDHAQFELATRYLTGKGTDPDLKLAHEWLNKAAKQGHREAKKKLAELGPYKEAVETEVQQPAASKLKKADKSEAPAVAVPKAAKPQTK